MGTTFAIYNIIKIVFFIAAVVMIGIVLIQSKKKRREQMHKNIQEFLKETDPNNDHKEE